MHHHRHHHFHYWFGLFFVGRYLWFLGVLALVRMVMVAVVGTIVLTILLGYLWGWARATMLVFGAIVWWAAE